MMTVTKLEVNALAVSLRQSHAATRSEQQRSTINTRAGQGRAVLKHTVTACLLSHRTRRLINDGFLSGRSDFRDFIRYCTDFDKEKVLRMQIKTPSRARTSLAATAVLPVNCQLCFTVLN